MNKSSPIFGFSILRNGVKYDYPFRESLKSLSALCEEVYLALGDSEDNTEEEIHHIPKLKIIPTVWDENLRKSGVILSVQTNIALKKLREDKKTGWAIYLQADEVLNPSQFEQLKLDLQKAEAEGCDNVSFRYLHFWQSYDRIAVSPRWYPQEVRAIRLESDLESYGDAQGFKVCRKKFQSDVIVYHYGHVREAKAYERKKGDFHRWWHSDEELKKVLAKGERRDKKERLLDYYGPHPSFMEKRMGQQSAPPKRKIWVYGDRASLPEEFWGKVCATLHFTKNLGESPCNWEDTVFLEPAPLMSQLMSLGKARSRVPNSMLSPQALPWPKEFLAILRFSEKKVQVL